MTWQKGVVLGMNGARRGAELPPAVPAEVCAGLLSPPEDLAPEQAACWRDLAPKALEERTLTPNTAPAFRELCARTAILKQLDARIALLGVGTQDSLPYLRERRGQAAQVAAAYKDFKLSAFGKAVTSDKPKAENPFAAAFGGKG